MEEQLQVTASEAVEFGEFKRRKREAEISLTLKRLVLDASRRELDKITLKSMLERAVKYGVDGVLVSPINVASAKRMLGESKVNLCCLVGGTGESLTVIKRIEAKRAYRQGAKEIRLVPCYGALFGGNANYLKREFKRVRRSVKKCAFSVSLDDRSLSGEQIALAVRVARESGADAVTVRGEIDLVLRALEASAGGVQINCAGVENSEQLKLLLRAGIARATTDKVEQITEELQSSLNQTSEPPSVS